MDKSINFEQNIKELENVVRQLEGGDISLDELLALFEKGVGLAKTCNSELNDAEQKINMLLQNKTTGGLEEKPMGESGEGQTVPVEPPKAKGKHYVSEINELPPMPSGVAEMIDDIPPMPNDIPPETDNLQQAFMDIDSL